MIDNYIETLNSCKTKKKLISTYKELKEKCITLEEIKILDNLFNYHLDQFNTIPKVETKKILSEKLFLLAKNREINKESINSLCEEIDIPFNSLIELLEQETKNMCTNITDRLNYNAILYSLRKTLITENNEIESYRIKSHKINQLTQTRNDKEALFCKYKSFFNQNVQDAIKIFDSFTDKKICLFSIYN